MSLKNKIFYIALFTTILFNPGFIFAQDLSTKEPIVVNGDHVEYLQEKQEVIGTGNISITYKDIIMTCDKIKVNLKTSDAEAIGNVRITQKDAYFTGEQITYNFETRGCAIDWSYLNGKPFYGKAESLTKAPNKDEYKMEHGYVTTCDLDHPHYRIQAEKVKIYINDRVVAHNIIMFVGDIPIMYVPIYVQPITEERKSHITLLPGQSKDWGYYVLSAYRYYFNDDFRGDILVDYRSKKGLGTGINNYMDTKDIGKGAFKFYFTEENNALAYEKTGEKESRYRFQYRHKWDIKDTDTSATVEINKLSDLYMIRDYFYDEYEELGPNPDNYISFVTAKENYTTEFLVRMSLNNFYGVVERLPEYKIDILNYKLGNTLFYYNGNASGVYLNQTYPKTIPRQKDVGVIRFDAYNELSYAARFFKSLSVTPYFGVRETYYSRNNWGDTNEVRSAFSTGVDASMKFYKVYDVNTNFAGLDINKLRHIITPSANYYHTHQPTIAPENLHQFDSIDAVDTANGVLLSLENKLQTKRKSGDTMESVDLLRFIVNTDYMFRMDKHSLSLKNDKFNGVNFKIELIPYSWFYATSDFHVNTKTCIVDTANVDIVANGGDKWSFAAGQRFYDLDSQRSCQITMNGHYKINDKWKIRFYERFDLATKKFEKQEYTLIRDLHCWEAHFTYSIDTITNNSTFWLILTLKAFPEYPVGIQQTYSTPSFGSEGRN